MADENLINELAAQLLKQELAVKQVLLDRIAKESDIKPSRIPAPMNITEIGGYFNLMKKLKQEDMYRQTLSSVLGLPMQTPME
jgi:hypothetical protein